MAPVASVGLVAMAEGNAGGSGLIGPSHRLTLEWDVRAELGEQLEAGRLVLHLRQPQHGLPNALQPDEVWVAA